SPYPVDPTVTMAEMAKASDATSVLLESTELQFETAAMKIALARQMRPIRTQRSNRLGSRMTRSAASDDRGVSRTLAGRGRGGGGDAGGAWANCPDCGKG